MFEKTKSLVQGAISRGGENSATATATDDSAAGGNENRIFSKSNSRLTNKTGRPKTLCITVIFLDNSEHTFIVDKSAKGSLLLDKVFQHLELVERDYFGLQFEELPPPEVTYPLSNPHLRWIEKTKPLKKQIRFTKPGPTSFHSEAKKSSITSNSSASNEPNHHHSECNGTAKNSSNSNKLSSFSQVPSATVYFRVKFFVEEPSSLTEEYTRYQIFLQIRKDILEGRLTISPSTACLLASFAVQSEIGDFNPDEHDEYGNYLKNVQELSSLKLNGSSDLDELKGKVAQLHIRLKDKGYTPALADAKYLDTARRIEGYGINFHKVKDNNGKEILIGVYAVGLSVHYNGIKINTFSWSKITKIAFKRKQFFIQLRREASEEYDTLLVFECWTYKACKRLWKSCVEHHGFFRLSAPPQNRKQNILLLGLGSRFRYTGRTEYQTREDSNARQSQTRDKERKTFFRSQNKKFAFLRDTLGVGNGGGGDKENRKSSISQCSEVHNNVQSDSSKNNVMSNKVQSSCQEKEPRKAWADVKNYEEENGFGGQNGGMFANATTHISLNTKGIAFADDDENSLSDDGTVQIRLEPDQFGKFGFNIKGGSDMNCPVLVSRVAQGTPADLVYPRLNEGDQLVQINGRETHNMLHREIVQKIRSAATINKELFLKVKQNVYTTEDYEEPAFSYIPEVPFIHNFSSVGSSESHSLLTSSMLLLREAIEVDSISTQFELVYRKKPGLSCEIGKSQENMAKNRYRDILPYDSTRVILNSGSSRYINASHITIKIANGVVNRYIATQGPLPSTTDDFWSMVWDTMSPLIVMLTPICERGRIKCHPYYPQQLNSTVLFNNIQVTTMKENYLSHWIEREFLLKHIKTDEERVVIQLQYQGWPDHGVPEFHLDFIRFMEEVRKAKLGTVEPTIIHCSAGIGRTGVLILMETAECLIEANQPIYPGDILLNMRNQRPLMIQTSSQYRFVCECVLKVFEQGIIHPLPEFSNSSGSPPQSISTMNHRSNLSAWIQTETIISPSISS